MAFEATELRRVLFDGARGIFVERDDVSYVEISQVQVSSDRFTAHAASLDARGLSSRGRAWEFAAAWSDARLGARTLSSRYGGWRFCFEPAAIQEMLRIASALPAGQTVRDDVLRDARAPAHRKFLAVTSSGPVRKALMGFIDRLEA